MDSWGLAAYLRWILLSQAMASAPWAFSTEAADDQPVQSRPWRAYPPPDSASSRPRKETEPTPGLVGQPTPRVRVGADLVLGANGIFVPASDSHGAYGTHGTGGIGFSFRIGPQWSELLSTEIELTGLFGPLLEGRAAVVLGLTPLDWLSLSIGPAAGDESGTESFCGTQSYSGAYFGGIARIDYFPGVGPPTGIPRSRGSFDLGLVALVAAPGSGPPQGDSLFGWGLYLELGYLQF